MNNMLPEGFGIQEISDPYTYQQKGDKAIEVFNPYALATLGQIKRAYNYTMILNTYSFKNWQKFGNQQWKDRGFRSIMSATGVKGGVHYNGDAFDTDFYNNGVLIPADKMRAQIIKDRAKFPYIAGIEKNVPWVHFDVFHRNGYVEGKICIFAADGTYEWV